MSVKIVKSYRSSFERQIGESVMINHNLRENVQLLNSKNEYNRCSIPRLGLAITKDDIIDEYRERWIVIIKRIVEMMMKLLIS